MTTTYELKRKLQAVSRLLKAISGGKPWNRDGLIVQFDGDEVHILRKGSDEYAYYGLREDDPFLTTGVTLEESLETVNRFYALMSVEKSKLQ